MFFAAAASRNMFSILPNSASFCVTFDDEGLCFPEWLGKKYLKDSVTLNPILLTWINCWKRDKKVFLTKWKNLCSP